MITVSEAVAGAVVEHTTEVFALMGNGNAYFTDALARGGRVRMTGLRHEAATVASADAYYRVSRRIAVATTTYGPGYTNALTPLAEAVCSRTPLVFVVGGEPTTGPRPWDVDQVALAQGVGARTLTVDTKTPAATTREAFRLAQAERLPVVLFIPYDTAAAPAADEHTPSTAPSTVSAEPLDQRAIAKAAGLLSGAHRPLILAGRGARDAAAYLGGLADRIGALTTTSAPARGTFAGRGFDLGVCGGFASEDTSKLIRQADVVLAVGVGLNQFTTAFGTQFSPEATLIQIDVLPEKTNPMVDVYIRGDASEAASVLLELLTNHTPPARPWEGIAEDARGSRLNFSRDPGTGQAPDGRLDPRTAMEHLNRILPANRQIVSDGGHFIGWTSYYFDLPAPDSLTMVGTQYQSIGLGLPSAPGAALARPDATTIVATGDGGGLMGLPDLDSLVRTAKSAVVLVFNDACYGAEIHQYGSQGLDQKIMEIDQVDFAKLAEGFGATGLVAHTMDDLDAVQHWVDEGARGTLVVDLRISRNVIAPYILEIIELTLKKK
ncbi:thiamine pyrophosphate-binding protein [Arthrobacter crystallopoietes]|uniref:Acetolactate synthase large subunit n=1 Tax=Crystallibacter crystallopoietes TaxID=37928 RepID=A0A1H1BVZ6_9MICC|nr:thiamine pyrophosphate-binding protein [Arthrobacter crystallopoietes]AUI50993.1 hypothetical protein AC20117_09360 [Arthrobacter crystallopoietes]SDQ56071.1 Acetolactate synthase large subunit [Arthrobacter crystallopoietes]